MFYSISPSNSVWSLTQVSQTGKPWHRRPNHVTQHLLWHYLLNSLLHYKDFSCNFRVKFQSEQWNLGLFVFSSLKLLKHLNSMGKLLILFQKYLLSSA